MINSCLIDSFKTISLKEMGKVRLMNRIDTKYVTTTSKVRELLELMADDYYIQEIGGRSYMPYYTRYYDTPDVEMYYQHQRGKKARQKVRIRQYEASDAPPFIEIKLKNNKGRTKKERIALDNNQDLSNYSSFFSKYSHYCPNELIPQIENHFYRITLVNREMTERITIDTNIQFHNLTTDLTESLDNIAIIEWKRDGRNKDMRLEPLLRKLHIHPSGFSKYCIGMATTNPSLTQNRLKERIRMVRKINSSPLNQ